MPRRHKRDKAKAKSLLARQKRKEEEKLLKKLQHEDAEGISEIDKANVVAKLLFGEEAEASWYEDRQLWTIINKTTGNVMSSIEKHRLLVLWKWATGKRLEKHELEKEISERLLDMDRTFLEQLMQQLVPRLKEIKTHLNT